MRKSVGLRILITIKHCFEYSLIKAAGYIFLRFLHFESYYFFLMRFCVPGL